MCPRAPARRALVGGSAGRRRLRSERLPLQQHAGLLAIPRIVRHARVAQVGLRTLKDSVRGSSGTMST